MNRHREGFGPLTYVLFILVTLAVMIVCICLGSVSVPLKDTLRELLGRLPGSSAAATGSESLGSSIIWPIRLPRVLCVALVGASLSLGGASMQGLLKNPLADGSTLGVSSGASLGAIIAIALGISIPGVPFSGTVGLAVAFAFGSLMVIISLAYRLDSSLSTNTVILLGVVFAMFISSISNLIITFAADHVKTITFWTLGSLQGSSYANALLLLAALAVCGTILLSNASELNAFAIGEDNARSIGVNVRRVKLTVLICVSILTGVCVSVSGSIGFVGLVTPHILRNLTGPNHKRLLPASIFGGAVFLLLADLIARTLIRPRELPIGVVTSIVGAFIFIYIFYRTRSQKDRG